MKKELELYIHIPFCVQKCKYCDFLSTAADTQTREAYMQALQQEIYLRAPFYNAYTISSVFIGGGTPTSLESTQIKALMQALKSAFQISKEAEITIECNPGTVTKEKLDAIVAAGINRISFGVQSANDSELHTLGRIHTWAEFEENYAMARAAGIRNCNIDIMMALPGQKVETYEKTLKKVCVLEPEHISAYSLIIEPGTNFYETYETAVELREAGKEQSLLPDEDAERKMYELTKKLLASYGYEQYEISNFAKKGYECKHNVGYWQRVDYLGLGLGSSSCVEQQRFVNTSDRNIYIEESRILSLESKQKKKDLAAIESSYRKEIQCLSMKEQMEETMFLGLRLNQGVSKQQFLQQFQKSVHDVYKEAIKKCRQQQLLAESETHLYLTEAGRDVANYCMAEFLIDEG